MLEREPLIFAVGDTLSFERYLPDYLPTAGWSLLYEIRGGAAGDDAVQFTSTVDGNRFKIEVPTSITTPWVPGDYILVGYAVNAGLVERHQFYYAEITLTPNLGDGGSGAPTTHAQRMIPLIEAQLEQLAMHVMDATTVEKTELIRVKRDALEKQLAWNKTIRNNEIALENVANGRPSGSKIVTQFNIVGGGCAPYLFRYPQ